MSLGGFDVNISTKKVEAENGKPAAKRVKVKRKSVRRSKSKGAA